MTKGLTLPEWIVGCRKVLKERRDAHKDGSLMERWLSGWEACLNSLESDMKDGLLEGGGGMTLPSFDRKLP